MDDGSDLTRRLDLWVAEGVIRREDAEAIAAFESRQTPVPTPAEITPVTEALLYLAAALGIAGIGTALGSEWSELPTAARIAVPALITVVLVVVGWWVHDETKDARIRLGRVLWFLSSASLAWCVGVVLRDALDIHDAAERIWTGAIVAAYAAALNLVRPATLQQLAFLGGLVLLGIGITEGEADLTGLGFWVLGVAWIFLGWRRLLVEASSACTAGTLLVLVGLLIVSLPSEEAGAVFRIATCAGLIGAAVGMRHTGMLVLGAIGLFFSIFGTVIEYVEGATGVAIGLLAAGAVVLAIALAVSRLGRARSRPERPG